MEANLGEKLASLTINHTLVSFAESLVSAFTTLVLIKRGFPVPIVVILFVGIYCAQTILFIFTDRVVKKIGFKNMLVIGTLSYAPYYFILSIFSLRLEWILCYILAGSLNYLFFWLPLHTLFSMARKRLGAWVAVRNVAAIVMGLFAPLAGSLLILYNGKDSLFVAAAIISLLATIPLFWYSAPSVVDTQKKFSNPERNYSGRIQFLAGVLAGLISIAWPLAIYIVVPDLVKVGVIVAITVAAQIFFTFLAGKDFDRRIKPRHASLAGGLLVISLLAMAFFPGLLGVLGIIIAGSLYQVANSFFDTFRILFWYQEANKGVAQDSYSIYQHQKHSLIAWKLGYALGVLLLVVAVFAKTRPEISLFLLVPCSIWLTAILRKLSIQRLVMQQALSL